MPPADAILRDPGGFAADHHDLVVVGGGIYGVMLALEAARRGLSCLLLERDDFGEHTSYNHLRILHGGFRYLQDLDVRRLRESGGERAWFLRHFPGLTRPLPCLLPLYGGGLRRPAVMRAAFALEALLSLGGARGLPRERRLPAGNVLSAGETRRRFPLVRPGVLGGAFWHDGVVLDSPRLLMETLRWACRHGARAVNHCAAEGLLLREGAVAGVRARDRRDGGEHVFRSARVVNAAGPWCRSLAAALDRDHPELFPHRVLVWNLLFDRPTVAQDAVAVTPPRPGGRTYFLLDYQGELLAGTGHAVQEGEDHRPPPPEAIAAMIGDLNAAAPGLGLVESELRRVFWGVMPGDPQANLASRPVLLDHAARGGPAGLFTISGVKFTTARLVADRTLRRLFPSRRPRPYGAEFAPAPEHAVRGRGLSLDDATAWRDLVRHEAPLSLADLVLRRSDVGERAGISTADLERLAAFLDADRAARLEEVDGVLASIRSGLPAAGPPATNRERSRG
ncbi:MAG: FAD-dependent oxidoreductase [Candidatus Krumholzibacteriia bacterium]